MEYKKISKDAYNIHFIKTDKFKKVKVRIDFKEKVSKENIAFRNLLSIVLLEATKKYNTRRLVDIQCEYLYNIGVGSGTCASGNYNILQFDTTFLNEKYTEKGMTEDSLKFFLEFIFNPNVTNGEFDELTFNNSVNVLKEDIMSFEDSPARLAYYNVYNVMRPGTPLVYKSCGYLEDLEKITRKSLYDYYKELITNNIIDIFIVGDVDFKMFEKIIDDNFKINSIKDKGISHFITYKDDNKDVRYITDKKKIRQSVLVLGFKLGDLTEFERRYVLMVYNYILGSSGNSKLFKDVREKNSLCYHISSNYSSIANLEFISAGIDSKNYDKALEVILKDVKDMEDGNFLDEDVNEGITNVLTSTKEIEDSIGGLLNLCEAHEYLDSDFIDEKRKKIVKVTKDDVIKVAKKVTLDTVYLLEGDLKND